MLVRDDFVATVVGQDHDTESSAAKQNQTEAEPEW